MDPRTYHEPRHAGATWNAGLNNWQSIHRNNAPNPFFVNRDFFPSSPASTKAYSYRALGVPLPVATGSSSYGYAQASTSKATPLQQPHLLERFSQRFENAKPKTRKRVHFAEVGTPEPSSFSLVSLITSIYAFFVAATLIVLGALAHCIIGAISFTLQVIHAQYTSFSESWRTSWYPWMENRWKSWRLGFEVRPLPKLDTRMSSSQNRYPNEFWRHRINAKHHLSQKPRVPLPERSVWQGLRSTFARSVNLVKQSSIETLSWSLHTAYRLLSLLLITIARIPSFVLRAVHNIILSLARVIAQIPSFISSVVQKSSSALYQTTLTTTERLYDFWLDICEWWEPLPMRPSKQSSTNLPSVNSAPSVDRAKLARALGRRRRQVTPEQSGSTSSSANAPQSTNPTPSSSSSNAASTSTSAQPPAIRRPKSLQHARQWRKLHLASTASSSSSSLAPPPPPPKPLPRIDLHLQVARHALSAFSKLRQFFSYPDAATPELQDLMEDIYDNPVRIAAEGSLVRAPSPDQPAIVVHQMFWQGEREKVGEVLGVALASSLTVLRIGNCEIGISDVVAILAASPFLDSLEVKEVVADERAGPMVTFPGIGGVITAYNLSSLTITSHSRLNLLFDQVRLLRLSSLSLRLHGDGNKTSFDNLLSTTFASVSKLTGPRSFRLRGQLPPTNVTKLEVSLARQGVDFEYLAH